MGPIEEQLRVMQLRTVTAPIDYVRVRAISERIDEGRLTGLVGMIPKRNLAPAAVNDRLAETRG
jgi:hypothetical protein